MPRLNLYFFNPYGSQPFFTLLQLKGYFVALFDLVNQIGMMNKILFGAVVVFNETVPFVVIKEFYFTCFHDIKIIEKIAIDN